MRKRIGLKAPSPALVISCVALFVALGSAGWAATGGNFKLGLANSADAPTSLTSNTATGQTLQLENTGGKQAAKFTTATDVAPFVVNSGSKVAKLNVDKLDGTDSTGFVQTTDGAGGDLSGLFSSLQINPSTVTGTEVADESLSASDLGANSVGSSEIATDAVGATEIQDSSIDSGEIVDFGLSNQDIGVLFGQINADGTVANSSGGVTTIKLGTGTYEVDFGRNISACAFVATQGEAGVGGAPGAIMGVTDRSGNVNAVFVTVRTDANALVDRAFQLVVVC